MLFSLHTPWFFLLLPIEHWRAIEGDGPGLEGDVERPRTGFKKPDHVSFAAIFLQIFYMPSILPFSCLTLCLFISTFNAALERDRRTVEVAEEETAAVVQEEATTEEAVVEEAAAEKETAIAAEEEESLRATLVGGGYGGGGGDGGRGGG